MNDARAKLDLERHRLQTGADFIITESIAKVVSAHDALRPLAGGRTDGTIWTDHLPEGMDIMKYFQETLDKVNPSALDKHDKALKKVSLNKLCYCMRHA